MSKNNSFYILYLQYDDGVNLYLCKLSSISSTRFNINKTYSNSFESNYTSSLNHHHRYRATINNLLFLKYTGKYLHIEA